MHLLDLISHSQIPSTILDELALHRTYEAVELGRGAAVVDHGDALQLLIVSLNRQLLVIKLIAQTFHVDHHIVRRAHYHLVML